MSVDVLRQPETIPGLPPAAAAEAGKMPAFPADLAALPATVPECMICWDPDLVETDDYVDLVASLGDLVRASGGAGVKRVSGASFELVRRAS